MDHFDDTIQDLQAQVVRQRGLLAERESLIAQKGALQKRVDALRRAMDEAQADVDRLEGRTLAALFYAVLGQRAEKLSREQQEAHAAALRYAAASEELEAVRRDLARAGEELSSLRGCEARLRAALDRKAAALRASGTPEAARLLDLERRLAQNAAEQREVQEAIQAGRDARSTADSVLASLDSAAGWGTWDLVGGGLLTDLAKHGCLDDAQTMLERLRDQLRRFGTELADTAVYAELQVRVDGFLRFADFFFDGLLADWAVLDHIEQSKAQVADVCRQLRSALNRLDRTAEGLRGEAQDLQTRRDELVASVCAAPEGES